MREQELSIRFTRERAIPQITSVTSLLVLLLSINVENN
jgi:hypothetical protein